MRYLPLLALVLAAPAGAQTGPQISFGTPASGGKPIQVRDPTTGAQVSLGTIAGGTLQTPPAQADTAFPLIGRIYNQADPVHRYARTFIGNPLPGARTNGVSEMNVAIIDPGSGALSDPDLAGFALTANAEKLNYLGATTNGELDTLNLGLRNDRGDGSTILANAQGVVRGTGMGTITAWESHTTLVDPVTNTLTQDINVQLGAAENTGTSGGLVGFFGYKSLGAGGTGVLVNSVAGAPWEWEARFGNLGVDHLAIRASDGALVHYALSGAATTQFAMVNDGTVENLLYNGMLAAQISAAVFGVQGRLITKSYPPASSTATCTTGTQAWDANYIYVCVATNTWKRAALAGW